MDEEAEKCFVHMDGLHPDFDLAGHLRGSGDMFFKFIENQTGCALTLRGTYESGGEKISVDGCTDESLHIEIRFSDELSTEDASVQALARNEGKFAVKHLIRTTQELYCHAHPGHPLENRPSSEDTTATALNSMDSSIISPKDLEPPAAQLDSQTESGSSRISVRDHENGVPAPQKTAATQRAVLADRIHKALAGSTPGDLNPHTRQLLLDIREHLLVQMAHASVLTDGPNSQAASSTNSEGLMDETALAEVFRVQEKMCRQSRHYKKLINKEKERNLRLEATIDELRRELDSVAPNI